jgi:long-chain fatty acid transport protein
MTLSERRCAPGAGRSAAVRVALAVTLWAALDAPVAHAGNRSTYFVGGRAAGMAGAFTAFGDDGSAAWYNPAALPSTNRHSFDLSASAYGFELIDVGAMVRTTLGQRTNDSDFSASALAIVPTSLDAVFRLSDRDARVRHALAFSVIVPVQRNISQTFEFAEPLASYKQKFRLADQVASYHIGPSYGVWLNEHVSVGGSLFVVYDQFESTASAYFHRDLTTGGAPLDWFFLSETSEDGLVLGLTASVAVQLRFDGFRLGAQLRSPVMRLYTSAESTNVNAVVQTVPDFPRTESDFTDDDRSISDWGFEQVAPLSLTLGLGWDVPQSWRLGVDVTWHSSAALANAPDFRHTINVALGGEVWLTDALPLSFGLFTDFAPQEDIAGFGERKMDYYGGTLAVSFLSAYAVADSEKSDQITFATTLGLHYAYGSGQAVGILFDFDRSLSDLPRRAATGHDIHLFVGSTVRY